MAYSVINRFKICFNGWIILNIYLVIFQNAITAQELLPGFDKRELQEIMSVSAHTGGKSNYYKGISLPTPNSYHFIYRSAEIGLSNLWELWTNDFSSAIITIRGTVSTHASWIANNYAAMVPAKGQLILTKSDTFNYQLADDDRAAVHVGWLICAAYLSRDILPKIDSCYKKGIRDFIITGHSQGGAISYLLTAYFKELQTKQLLPYDIRFKTYCTAAPKPGNLYFAYSYERATQGGWAFNVVNPMDWVPQVPFSIEKFEDIEDISPYRNLKADFKKLPFPKNIIMLKVYRKLHNPSKMAQNNCERYLGKMTFRDVHKVLKELKEPVYFNSSNYVRTGETIVLKPDSSYFKLFPKESSNIYIHHSHLAYIYLIDRLSWGKEPVK